MQVSSPVSSSAIQPKNEEALMASAKELEAVFLGEMLKSAGFGKAPTDFGGGLGEDQFSSFFVGQQAKAFSEQGGIGLAEHIFNAMKEKMA